MKVYLLNFADDRFGNKDGHYRRNQVALNESAIAHGIRDIVAWSWDDFARTDFYYEHKKYLDQQYYINGHAFKPYIILDLLQRVAYGDVVFYYDCGPYLIKRSIQPCIDLCVRNKGTLFHQWGNKNRQWTKRDAFVFMNCDESRYHNAVALQNTWLFLQKTDFTLKFIEEWLRFNLDERIATYAMPDTCGLPSLKGFVQNRGDQSIMTNLAIKYKLKTFFGAGGPGNRDINYFMRWLPRTFWLIPVYETIRKGRLLAYKWFHV